MSRQIYELPELSVPGVQMVALFKTIAADDPNFDVTIQIELNHDEAFTKSNVLWIRYKTIEMELYFMEDNVDVEYTKQITVSIYDHMDMQYKRRLIRPNDYTDMPTYINKVLSDLLGLCQSIV